MYVLINQARLGHEGAKECVPVIGPFFSFFLPYSRLQICRQFHRVVPKGLSVRDLCLTLVFRVYLWGNFSRTL